jgi:hypothetical protein
MNFHRGRAVLRFSLMEAICNESPCFRFRVLFELPLVELLLVLLLSTNVSISFADVEAWCFLITYVRVKPSSLINSITLWRGRFSSI